MTAYTLSANTNIDALSPARTGGDTINTNGFTFVVDQDSRFGLGGGTGFSFGNMTINATKGGKILIDARKVRLIAYTGGSGNVPAYNTTISQGGASGKLIAVMSSITAAPTAPGAAMPASGFIKIKQWNDVAFTSGALTGITATSSGADVVGWIEVVGDEGTTLTANRLGSVEILGDWYLLGTTSGASNQTLQIPQNGYARYVGGVYIETSAGSNSYEFWPNAGTTTTTGTEAARGKVVWIDATGLVRIGNSGAATNGHTPTSGRKVVVGNVFLENCTTTTRTANAIPSATVGTRYDFTTTGGGVVMMEKVSCAWYLVFSQAFSVALTDVSTIDSIRISELASPLAWIRVGVGNKPTTALLTNPLVMSLCFAGGTFTDCVWARVSHASSGSHTLSLTDISGFTFLRNIIRANTIRGNATTYSINAVRIVNCDFTDCTIIQGSIALTTCSDVNTTNLIYIDAVSGTTVTTYTMYIWYLLALTNNCVFSGLSLPVTNTHPYGGLIYFAAASCYNIILRNIGTYGSPLNLGSANATAHIAASVAGSSAFNIKFQRVHCSNTRTGIYSFDNSNTRLTFENVSGDYADAPAVSSLNTIIKAMKCTHAGTAATSVYGTHWIDCFTSSTAGRFLLVMNESTELTASQISLTNGAGFTSTGTLYMPTIGMSATFTMPYYALGHTSFQNSALVMAGGTATHYTYAYQIDKNNGTGWSSWSAELTPANLGTALSGETGIDATKGVKLKLRITTSTTNTSGISSVYVLTNSTTETQAYEYPLDSVTLQLTGLRENSDIVILDAGTTTERVNVDSNPGTTYAYVFSTGGPVDICVYKSGYVPFTIRNYSLPLSNASLPIAQVIDRNYMNL